MENKTYVVTNEKGLAVWSRPDLKTSAITCTLMPGEVFQVVDVFALGNITWGRVSKEDGTAQEYTCLTYGKRIYAQEQVQEEGRKRPTCSRSYRHGRESTG